MCSCILIRELKVKNSHNCNNCYKNCKRGTLRWNETRKINLLFYWLNFVELLSEYSIYIYERIEKKNGVWNFNEIIIYQNEYKLSFSTLFYIYFCAYSTFFYDKNFLFYFHFIINHCNFFFVTPILYYFNNQKKVK